MAKFKLSKPYTFEDVTYEEFEYDLENLTGEDLESVEQQMTTDGKFAPVPAVNQAYCARMGALAAKQPPEFITKLPAKDYTRFTQEVSNFLLKEDSQEKPKKGSPAK